MVVLTNIIIGRYLSCLKLYFILYFNINMYKTNKKFLFEEKNVKILDLIKSSKIIDNEDRISFSENYLK